ncbi:cuticle collagen 2-like [Serinus canaria]|uniref:cuticle collagen 2-like n=1 Tax=Serinus canaria TaxID=9135 RepID=UPI0021CD14DD|nr:cuticle collagen 2-like [Serinus canaria]
MCGTRGVGRSQEECAGRGLCGADEGVRGGGVRGGGCGAGKGCAGRQALRPAGPGAAEREKCEAAAPLRRHCGRLRERAAALAPPGPGNGGHGAAAACPLLPAAACTCRGAQGGLASAPRCLRCRPGVLHQPRAQPGSAAGGGGGSRGRARRSPPERQRPYLPAPPAAGPRRASGATRSRQPRPLRPVPSPRRRGRGRSRRRGRGRPARTIPVKPRLGAASILGEPRTAAAAPRPLPFR